VTVRSACRDTLQWLISLSLPYRVHKRPHCGMEPSAAFSFWSAGLLERPYRLVRGPLRHDGKARGHSVLGVFLRFQITDFDVFGVFLFFCLQPFLFFFLVLVVCCVSDTEQQFVDHLRRSFARFKSATGRTRCGELCAHLLDF
jgi:hypothetical protein